MAVSAFNVFVAVAVAAFTARAGGHSLAAAHLTRIDLGPGLPIAIDRCDYCFDPLRHLSAVVTCLTAVELSRGWNANKNPPVCCVPPTLPDEWLFEPPHGIAFLGAKAIEVDFFRLLSHRYPAFLSPIPSRSAKFSRRFCATSFAAAIAASRLSRCTSRGSPGRLARRDTASRCRLHLSNKSGSFLLAFRRPLVPLANCGVATRFFGFIP
jgi:hypothetical protein